MTIPVASGATRDSAGAFLACHSSAAMMTNASAKNKLPAVGKMPNAAPLFMIRVNWRKGAKAGIGCILSPSARFAAIQLLLSWSTAATNPAEMINMLHLPIAFPHPPWAHCSRPQTQR